MCLRLPEQSSQRKQQSGRAVPESLHAPSLAGARPVIEGPGVMGVISEKQLKKVLTLSTEIAYHGGRFQKRQRLLPGRVLCLFGSL